MFPTILALCALAAGVGGHRLDSGHRLDATSAEASGASVNPRPLIAVAIPAWCSAFATKSKVHAPRPRHSLLASAPPAFVVPAPAADGRARATSLDSWRWVQGADVQRDELLEKTEDYDLRQVRLRRTVRLKVLPARQWNNRTSKRERLITKRFRGPRLLDYIGSWRKGKVGYLALEDYGDTLENTVLGKSFDQVNLIERLKLVLDLLDGLVELEKHGFCHGNINPRTVFVSFEPEMHLKIGGFESACRWRGRLFPWNRKWRLSPREKGQAPLLHLPYLSPGVHQKRELDSAADVFAVGMILYELLFEGVNPMEYYETQMYTEAEALGKWQDFDMLSDKAYMVALVAAAESNPWLQDVLMALQIMCRRNPKERASIKASRDTLHYVLGQATRTTSAEAILRSSRAKVAAECDKL